MFAGDYQGWAEGLGPTWVLSTPVRRALFATLPWTTTHHQYRREMGKTLWWDRGGS